MTIINLSALSDFQVGEVGCVFDHTVMKTDRTDTGVAIVVATEPVKAGMSGWFETQT